MNISWMFFSSTQDPGIGTNTSIINAKLGGQYKALEDGKDLDIFVKDARKIGQEDEYLEGEVRQKSKESIPEFIFF